MNLINRVRMRYSQNKTTYFKVSLLLIAALALATDGLFAQEGVEPAAPSVGEEAMFAVNNVWMMVATFLVFIMHLGFATLESGLTQAKNTVNILFKNTFIVALGLLTYALVGFNLMYPGDAWMGAAKYFGFAGFGIESPEGAAGLIDYAGGAYTYWTDFLFQGMFAATAATIISGAVAERIKLLPFFLVITIYVAFVYPVAGSWKWGAGWLDDLGFYDFAGSTIVHAVGGWGALVGVMILGPRTGKYGPNGTIKPIFGHNMPLATIGVFLLWLGWFGFNGGSVLSADPGATSFVLVTTCLAAAAGIISAGFTSLFKNGNLDLSMALNGSLAGLVGITAGADVVTPLGSIIIGLIAGVIVVFSVSFFDAIKLDDPVGAISVHLMCGIWGTVAVGIFSTNPEHTLTAQLIGIVAIGAWCLIWAFTLFFAVDKIFGLRVSREEEIKGLDLSEHGMESYSGFQIYTAE